LRGTVFGPQPRDYTTDVPRKVKQLARRSALNARAREQALYVVEAVRFAEPKTKQLVELLGKLGLGERKVVLLTNGHNRNAWLSSRNLERVHVMPWAEASAYDVIWGDALVVEEGALTGAEPDATAATAERRATRGVGRGVKAPKAAKAKKPAARAAAKKPAKKAPAKKAAPKKKGK
jgi:large subunit ribosomal protein L4